MSGIESLLASYPRPRPPLAPGHAAGYVEHYRSNRSGEGALNAMVSGLEGWMHHAIARTQKGRELLDLGAGNLNHVRYEAEVEAYDAVEPFRALWQDSPYLPRIRNFYEDIGQVPHQRKYGSVISVAVLEHLTDLPLVVAHAALLLAPGGRFLAGIPSEGGLLWGMAWRFTTGMAYRLRHGLDYGAIMRHEHLNSAPEIRAVLDYFFATVALRRFPLPVHHLSFYTFLSAEGPRLDRCAAFCRARTVIV